MVEPVGVTLDAGALIAADRNDRRFWIAWKQAAGEERPFRLPAIALTQAWRGGSHPRMSRVLAACDVVATGTRTAKAAGQLLAASGGSDAVDATVISLAAESGDEVWTSDVSDLRALAEVTGRWIVLRSF